MCKYCIICVYTCACGCKHRYVYIHRSMYIYMDVYNMSVLTYMHACKLMQNFACTHTHMTPSWLTRKVLIRVVDKNQNMKCECEYTYILCTCPGFFLFTYPNLPNQNAHEHVRCRSAYGYTTRGTCMQKSVTFIHHARTGVRMVTGLEAHACKSLSILSLL